MKKQLLLSVLLILLCFFTYQSRTGADITNDLIGKWDFDEGTGTTVMDSSENDNSGTLVNGPIWTIGQFGNALSFDGVNDYVNLGNPYSLIPGSSMTLAGWVNYDRVDVSQILISKYGASDPNISQLRLQGGGAVRCSIGGTTLTVAAGITSGNWYHLACTYNGSNITIYVNGVSIGTLAKTGDIADAVGIDWRIGTNDVGNLPMSGLIENVRIYGRALSPSDVSELYYRGNINVTATLDGEPWSSNEDVQIDYILNGPETVDSLSVPKTFNELGAEGIYTLTYRGGGPEGATLTSITPVSSQFLPTGSTISFTMNFTSEEEGSFDYSLSNSGTSYVTKASGNAFTENTITKILASDISESVTLDVSGHPNGVTYTVSNPECLPDCTSVINFTVAPSAPVGTFPITVVGSPLEERITEFDLVISGDPLIVSCSVSPTTVLVGETITFNAEISGGTPPYIYAWEGTNIPTSPAPSTNPFEISYGTVGEKTTFVTVTDSGEPPIQTSCPPITIKARINPLYQEF